MTPDEEVIRGHRAAQILNDPLVKDSFEETRRQILMVWEATPARDIEAREWCFKLYQASLKYEEVFKGYIDTGRVSAENIKINKGLFGKLKSI